jgi:hypothetical protein
MLMPEGLGPHMSSVQPPACRLQAAGAHGARYCTRLGGGWLGSKGLGLGSRGGRTKTKPLFFCYNHTICVLYSRPTTYTHPCIANHPSTTSPRSSVCPKAVLQRLLHHAPPSLPTPPPYKRQSTRYPQYSLVPQLPCAPLPNTPQAAHPTLSELPYASTFPPLAPTISAVLPPTLLTLPHYKRLDPPATRSILWWHSCLVPLLNKLNSGMGMGSGATTGLVVLVAAAAAAATTTTTTAAAATTTAAAAITTTTAAAAATTTALLLLLLLQLRLLPSNE